MTMPNEAAIEKIVNVCIGMMVAHANVADTGPKVTASDIVSAIIADPTGEIARYLAEGVAGGIKWFNDITDNPELLEVFGA